MDLAPLKGHLHLWNLSYTVQLQKFHMSHLYLQNSPHLQDTILDYLLHFAKITHSGFHSKFGPLKSVKANLKINLVN